MGWDTFLKAHWGAIAAADFFSLEIITRAGLVRYFVLFVIDLKTRRVEIAGIVQQPNGVWMKQIARNLTDAVDGFLNQTQYLIHDRDPLFTKQFRQTCKATGVRCLRMPKRSPNLNAFAESFVRAIKYECLNKMILFGQRHLRHVIDEYVDHYSTERPHQGIGNRPIEEADHPPPRDGPVRCRERLGGLLKSYHREAA